MYVTLSDAAVTMAIY